MRFKRSTAIGATLRSASFVGVTCLLAGHNVVSKRHGHALARTRKTTHFFYTNKIMTCRWRDERDTVILCAKLSAGERHAALPNTGSNRRDERMQEREECTGDIATPQLRNSRQSDVNCSANATPTPGNQSALSPTRRRPIVPLVFSRRSSIRAPGVITIRY